MSESPSWSAVSPQLRALADHYRGQLSGIPGLRLDGLDDGTMERRVEAALDRCLDEDAVEIGAQERRLLLSLVLAEAIGYGPLQSLLEDPTITEIMVNGAYDIFVERHGEIERVPQQFADNDHLLQVIERIAARVNRQIHESVPMVDARLPDGSRVNAIIPPLAAGGPTLTIRKFRPEGFSLDNLVSGGTLTDEMAALLRSAVRGRLNILVSGGTGAGKTTTLDVLASLVPARERIITIEDDLELHLRHDNVVSLEARPPNVEGRGEVSMRMLLRNSLRMRPDRIIIGEVRGPEALDMLQAMNTGHPGSMSTIHANSADDAFSRLETMVLSGAVDLPLGAVQQQIAAALHLVVQQARVADGTRRITQIAEVAPGDSGLPVTRELFAIQRSPSGYGFTRCQPPSARLRADAEFFGVSLPTW